MKFTLRWSYVLLGIGVTLLVNYKTFTGTSTTTSPDTTTQTQVEISDISSTIEVVGEAKLVDEQSLRFNKIGTVTKVYFKEGQSIKRGQVIAELDNTDGQSSIQEAQLNLENAQLSLDQLYDPVDKSQILSAQNSLLNAENALDLAKKELENLINSHTSDLESTAQNINLAKKELENLQSSYELALQEYQTLKRQKENDFNSTLSSKSTTIINIEDSFRSNLAQIEEIVIEADYIMGISPNNKDKNDDFESFLGAKDQNAKNDAKILLGQMIDTYSSLENLVLSYNYSGDKQVLLDMLGTFLTAYNALYKMTDAVYKTAEGSVVSVGTLDQSDIDSMKSKMSGYRTAILSKISTLNNNINTLNTLSDTDLLAESDKNTLTKQEESLKSQQLSIEKKQQDIELQEKNYILTQEAYQTSEDAKQKDITSKENTLQIAKINLEELQDGPTDENVLKAQNSIRQSEIRLKSAYESLDDYQLIAPFDGVIRKIDYQVGDNLTTDTDKYVYIENPNLLELIVLLDQIDITKVELGQDALTIFDAYPTQKVKSKIIAIDTTPIQNSGVVSYEVKIILDDDNFDKTILSGMTANIEIVTESRQGVLVVKSSAISEKDGKKYVVLQQAGGQEKEVEVQTGMSANGMTEIVSGLSRGDILLIKSFSTTSTTQTSTSLFSPPTGSRNRSNSSSGGAQGGPPSF